MGSGEAYSCSAAESHPPSRLQRNYQSGNPADASAFRGDIRARIGNTYRRGPIVARVTGVSPVDVNAIAVRSLAR